MKINRREFLVGSSLAFAAEALNEMVASAAEDTSLATRLASDPRRPQYHLLPPANWMNDPNGPIFWNGNYHMFYQHNPNAAVWGDMHWGHAISPDTVHWKHLPIALAPTPGGPDAAGCFSGTSVVDQGMVRVLYTGVVSAPEDQATIRDGVHSFRESQCLATSNDPELKTWTKQAAPVIAAPPAGLEVTGFRDPSPWRKGDTWYMTVGSGTPHQGGGVLLYRSSNLRQWEYRHFIAHGAGAGKGAPNPVASGDMWECPDFFPLDGRHVLIYSTQGKVCWQSGHLDEATMIFHPERFGVVDHGAYYAAKSQLDQHGNRILWGWIPETRPVEEYRASGWACLMSVPRLLTLSSEGDLCIGVSPAVDALRLTSRSMSFSGNGSTKHDERAALSIDGCCGELICSFRAGDRGFELSLTSPLSTVQQPWLVCRYDPARPAFLHLDDYDLPLNVTPDGMIQLRCLVDGSVIECCAGGKSSYTKRFYYPGDAAPRIVINTERNAPRRITASQLSPISHDRLTS